jgi:hypothetical protein
MFFSKFFLYLTLIIVVSSQNIAFAAFSRSTTFDKREICEKEKGVWREFGNSFADNCEPKFDKYMIAAQSLVFSCDCGPQKCWESSKCVEMRQYEKIFTAKKNQQEKEIAKQRKEREEEAIFLANEKIRKYYQENPNAAQAQNQTSQQNQGQNNNISQFRDKVISPVQTQPVVNQVIQNAQNYNNVNTQEIAETTNRNLENMVQNVQNNVNNQVNNSLITKILTPNSEPKKEENKPSDKDPNIIINKPKEDSLNISNPANDNSDGPTPFFLQQQENEKKLQEEKLNEQKRLQDEKNKNQKANQTNDQNKDDSLPQLPQIPLPQ